MFEFCLMMVNVICYAGLTICCLGLAMILTAMAMDMPRYYKEFIAKKIKKFSKPLDKSIKVCYNTYAR